METLQVGLDSWIVQDGNYGDFHVGQSARFALEFYPHAVRITERRIPMCEDTVGSRYRISAKAVFMASGVWVIDFGLRAYKNSTAPQFVSQGAWIEGEIYVGIDPFFYSEDLHAIPGMPELRYDFRIKKIVLETTPWLESKNEQGGTILTRDERHTSFTPVAETKAWEDDGGRAHYVLECEQIHAG